MGNSYQNNNNNPGLVLKQENEVVFLCFRVIKLDQCTVVNS